ncbi:YadA-like family protein [Escherichia coli]|nr:YadA-like family protein [Escherichia coli]
MNTATFEAISKKTVEAMQGSVTRNEVRNIWSNGLNSTITKKGFFVLLHFWMIENGFADLSKLALNAADCCTQVTFNSDAGIRYGIDLIQRSEQAHEKTAKKLAKWLEDFKAIYAEEYAAPSAAVESNETVSAKAARVIRSAVTVALFSAAVMAPAAHAATPSELAAAYDQYQHGAMQFNTLPEDAPVNQVNDAYKEAKDGLSRMGITGQNQEDLIANYSNVSDYQSAFKWAGVDAPSVPMTAITDTATKPTASAEDVAQNTKDIADNSGLIRSVAHGVTDNADAIKDNSHEIDVNSDLIRATAKGVTNNADAIATVNKTADTAKQTAEGVALVQMNQQRTAQQHVAPVTPKDGKDGVSITGATGKDGINGKDGVSVTGQNGRDGVSVTGAAGTNGKDGVTTIIHKTINMTDTATRSQVRSNTARLNKVESATQQNSSDIAENRKNIKRVGAMTQASSNLHYNRNENGYALAVGEYAGQEAIAGGMQFNTSGNSAITVQASYDGEDAGASLGFHSNW